jgi:hypothetical protein
MKNFFAALGIIFLILIVVGGAGFGYFAYTGNKLDASAKAYVDQSVPAIVTAWSKEELIKRASPLLMEKTTEDQINQLFSSLNNRLGAFQSYDGCKGQSYRFFTSKTGVSTTATYVATGTFANGKAEIQLGLVRSGDEWKILGFHVELKDRHSMD